jgi:putative transposase
MARLPRLSLAGIAHLVLLRGHNGDVVFRDEQDRQTFLSALRAGFERESVALHAYALPANQVWLLCTPEDAGSLGRAMQATGRRFAAAYNRRYQRTGSVWDGRYRSTVVEPGRMLLETMVFVDTAADASWVAHVADAVMPTWTSARQHLGFEGGLQLKDRAEYWSLGNTPFERAAAFRTLLDETASGPQFERIAAATRRGWALGSAAFLQALQQRTDRPVQPRRRGRPRLAKQES